MNRYFVSGGLAQVTRRLIQYPSQKPMVESIMEQGEAGEYLRRLTEMDQYFDRTMFAVKFSNFQWNWDRCQALVPLIRNSNNYWTVDAEELVYQQPYDELFDQLYQEHQLESPRQHPQAKLYKTYQSYSRNSRPQLQADLEQYSGTPFGVKLVRGAYYSQERREYPELICGTKEETDREYRQMMQMMIDAILGGEIQFQGIFATHNRADNLFLMEQCREHPELLDSLSSAQLMNMANSVQEMLVEAGIPTYIFVPYGSWREALPYLLRRLWENLDALRYMSR